MDDDRQSACAVVEQPWRTVRRPSPPRRQTLVERERAVGRSFGTKPGDGLDACAPIGDYAPRIRTPWCRSYRLRQFQPHVVRTTG